MRKRVLLQFVAAGVAASIAVAAMVVYSIHTGVAPVTIPIVALVVGPALAAAALVATCSMVAPPLVAQPLIQTVDTRSGQMDDAAEHHL